MNLRRLARLDTGTVVVLALFILVIIKLNFTFVQIFYFLKRNPALIFISLTSMVALMSWRSQKHLTRAKYTMEFQVSFSDSETMKKAAKTFGKHFSKMTTAELVQLAVDKSPKKHYDRMSEVLNAWERVGVALRHKVYDEEMLYEVYGTFLIKFWETVCPFVRRRQQDNPRLYIHIENLALRWKVRRNYAEEKLARLENKRLYKESCKRTNTPQ